MALSSDAAPVSTCRAVQNRQAHRVPGGAKSALLNRATRKMSIMGRGKSNTPWKLAQARSDGSRANAEAGSRVGFVGAGENCCGLFWHDCMSLRMSCLGKKRDGRVR